MREDDDAPFAVQKKWMHFEIQCWRNSQISSEAVTIYYLSYYNLVFIVDCYFILIFQNHHLLSCSSSTMILIRKVINVHTFMFKLCTKTSNNNNCVSLIL